MITVITILSSPAQKVCLHPKSDLLLVEALGDDIVLGLEHGGEDEGLAGVVTVGAHAQVHLHRTSVPLEGLGRRWKKEL